MHWIISFNFNELSGFVASLSLSTAAGMNGAQLEVSPGMNGERVSLVK